MRVEVLKIGTLRLVAENDADEAILQSYTEPESDGETDGEGLATLRVIEFVQNNEGAVESVLLRR